MFPEIGHYKLKGGYKKGDIERRFQTELLGLMRADEFICFHPQDIGYSSKFLDIHFITYGGALHWIELKKIQGSTFNVKNFEDDQVILLREMERRNPEIARVGIYSVKLNEYKVLRFSEIWDNKNSKGGVKIFDKK